MIYLTILNTLAIIFVLSVLYKQLNLIMWKKITEEHPPKNRVVMTKIEDENGTKNEQELKFDGKLWWVPDGSVYVDYTPTHWKFRI